MKSNLIAAALIAATAGSGCNARNNASYGGKPEEQLAAATKAVDLDAVNRLLAAGADPNKLAPFEGHYQSPWYFALHQLRRERRATVAIVLSMLGAHANPNVAYRQGPSLRAPDGVYTTQQGDPLLEVIGIGVPDVVRALFAAGYNNGSGGLALVLAVENGDTDVVHALVDAGVNVNPRNTPGTPLVAAIERRNVALMTYLEEHGAREKP